MEVAQHGGIAIRDTGKIASNATATGKIARATAPGKIATRAIAVGKSAIGGNRTIAIGATGKIARGLGAPHSARERGTFQECN